MPLRWISPHEPPQSSLAPEEPIIVLAAPGSIKPGQRLTKLLAAGSLLAVAFRPMPRAPATTYVVSTLNPSGAGSLLQAVKDANTHPGADTITFNSSLIGTIALTGTLTITDAVTIQGTGPGRLSVSGANQNRVFYLYSAGSLPFTTTISGLTIRDGLTKIDGGGIHDSGVNLVLDNVAVISNSAGSGGGISLMSSVLVTPTLTVRNSLVSGNQAAEGGGIFATYASSGLLIQNTRILSNSASDRGGGVLIRDFGGDSTIEDSTIAGNTASQNGGGIDIYSAYSGSQVIRRTTISGNTANSRGGGVYLYNVENLLIENSTISGNHANSRGGGVYLYYSTDRMVVQNSTIAGNSAGIAGGGVASKGGTMPITDTIVAGNTAINVPVSADITGTFKLKYDLVQITGTATISNFGGNLFGLDPLLGPLGDHGGPTQTRVPAHNSPVVDHGDPAFAEPPNTDQRGTPRVSGGRVDIGAVETQEQFLPLIRR